MRVTANAGLAWRLSAAARRSGPPLDGEIQAGAATAREAQRDLRTLLVTLHPPNLRRVGLHAALSDIAAPLRDAGVQVDLDSSTPRASSFLARDGYRTTSTRWVYDRLGS